MWFNGPLTRLMRRSRLAVPAGQLGSDTSQGVPKVLKRMERETGFEPATFSLGS